MTPANMPQAKLVEVTVQGLVFVREILEAREAINTVPGHRVIAHNQEKGQFLVTYRYEADRVAMDQAVQSVMCFQVPRRMLGLPLRFLRFRNKD